MGQMPPEKSLLLSCNPLLRLSLFRGLFSYPQEWHTPPLRSRNKFGYSPRPLKLALRLVVMVGYAPKPLQPKNHPKLGDFSDIIRLSTLMKLLA